MTTRHLDRLFNPRSIAVFGASNRPGSVGGMVMRNLLTGGFEGPVMPVNPHHGAVAGVLTYTDADSLPQCPDLAVICTPPETVVGVIDAVGRRGCRAAVVLTAGFGRDANDVSPTSSRSLLAAARAHDMRLLGPNCVGLLVPDAHMNASFAPGSATAGRVAFVSQSGAMCTVVLDWARSRGIGFSHFISLGDGLDVDFGDIIDYLGSDPHARAILLYIESVSQRRSFMSAARSAARNKPIIVIKAGRFAEGARAAHSHTGALAGADDVFDAAIRRAGMLRVFTMEELFAAVETLARARPLRGENLAILTNGGGAGVIATDALVAGGGHIAELSQATLAALDSVLPPTWSKGNPVDIIGDAGADRYRAALDVLGKAEEADAILVLYAPTAVSSSGEIADTVVAAARAMDKTVLTSWLGGEWVTSGRRRFSQADIPTYDTPGHAVGAFMHMVNYRRNQHLLTETPPSVPSRFSPDAKAARLIAAGALADGTSMLNEPESKAILAAYGIPVVETHIATSTEDAVQRAESVGYPVALKILSPDITHKTDVGGVALHLESAGAVRAAAAAMLRSAAKKVPEAKIAGFTVQRMVSRPGAHELIAGVATDPVFGPVILFGQGGTAVEVIGDRAVGLPPLNMRLAREIVERTRISRILAGYRGRPPVDMESVCLTLVQLSQIVVDIPEIIELDINPLYADQDGVLALDARIRVGPVTADESRRLAIRPYPRELEESYVLPSGRRVLLRPIRPEDEPEHHQFIARLTPEDIRFRFFGLVSELPHSEMARFTQIDYDREMAFIATAPTLEGHSETLGVVRTITDPDNERAEFAIVVRSDQKGLGLGWKLMDKMIRYCRARGTGKMVGQVLRSNRPMLDMAEELGMVRHASADADVYEVTLALKEASAGA